MGIGKKMAAYRKSPYPPFCFGLSSFIITFAFVIHIFVFSNVKQEPYNGNKKKQFEYESNINSFHLCFGLYNLCNQFILISKHTLLIIPIICPLTTISTNWYY